MKPAGAGYYVVCYEHVVGPFRSEEAAGRRMAAVEKLGRCPLDHAVRYLEDRHAVAELRTPGNARRANETMGFEFWSGSHRTAE